MDSEPFLPYSRQNIDCLDVDSIESVLKSDFLTQGPQVPLFEAELCKYIGVDYAVAANSATSSLHVACLALGVGVGDVVWTSPISFVASSNCALYCGATVDFVDIDDETLCLDVSALSEKLQRYLDEGKKLPKVVIPVHFGGQSCDMEKIAKLAKVWGFKVVEDASHALGGTYISSLLGESRIGSCLFSDITVFSFHPVKMITTGEGGVATTNNFELAEKMRLLRSHGIKKDVQVSDEGPWYYEQQCLGFNYRMTDISAALGISQLRKLNGFLKERRHIADSYEFLLREHFGVQKVPTFTNSSRHLFPVRVKAELRRNLFVYLRENGIGVNVHYIPIYRQAYYKAKESTFISCANAERYYSEAISIPIFPGLKQTDIARVSNLLYSGLSKFA